jgi:hypothetical protein
LQLLADKSDPFFLSRLPGRAVIIVVAKPPNTAAQKTSQKGENETRRKEEKRKAGSTFSELSPLQLQPHGRLLQAEALQDQWMQLSEAANLPAPGQ